MVLAARCVRPAVRHKFIIYIVLDFPHPLPPSSPLFQPRSLGPALFPPLPRLPTTTNMTTAGIEPVAIPPSYDVEGEIAERPWGLSARVDPSVTFEEYVYWAKIEREQEMEANRLYVEERGPMTVSTVLKNRFSKGVHHENQKKAEAAARVTVQEEGTGSSSDNAVDEKGVIADMSAVSNPNQEEWRVAARALRTASWGTIFYLITTDILGWSSTP